MITEIDLRDVPGIGLVKSITGVIGRRFGIDILLYKSFIDKDGDNDYILYLYLKKPGNKNELVVTRLEHKALMEQDKLIINQAILKRLEKTSSINRVRIRATRGAHRQL